MANTVFGNSVASDWQSYLCKVNGKPASIFFDQLFAKRAPFSGQPKLAWLWIKLGAPSEDGLSKDEEFTELCEYEDALCRVISQHENWHYVGRITTIGRREFYFYIPENDNFDDAIDAFLEDNSGYEFQTGESIDNKWDHYFKVLLKNDN